MPEPNKTVLVTGGAGYIGSHACKALAVHGYTPVSYDNFSNGHEWAVKWGPLETGDTRDASRLIEVIKKHHPIAVMHFAASIEIADSVKDPQGFYDNNVGSMQTLLTAMQSCELKHLVFSSSCAVYGTPDSMPITENCRVNPINPYGENKAKCESLIQQAVSDFGLSAISLRYFNAAGADPDCEIGESHDPESHLIPIVLQNGALREEVIMIYGDDYNTLDGTCVRDYIHVADLAEAHVKALDRLLAKCVNGTEFYNLGNGKPYTVKQVVDMAAAVTSRKINYEIADRRDGDVPILYADTSEARTQLGWQPEFNELETIIKTAWEWHKKQHRSRD